MLRLLQLLLLMLLCGVNPRVLGAVISAIRNNSCQLEDTMGSESRHSGVLSLSNSHPGVSHKDSVIPLSPQCP